MTPLNFHPVKIDRLPKWYNLTSHSQTPPEIPTELVRLCKLAKNPSAREHVTPLKKKVSVQAPTKSASAAEIETYLDTWVKNGELGENRDGAFAGGTARSSRRQTAQHHRVARAIRCRLRRARHHSE